MILSENLIPIGEINKPHGINGELSFSFTSDVFDTENLAYLIMSIEGIFVPFFIEEYRFKTNSTGLIKFLDIDTELASRMLIGLTVYTEKEHLDKIADEEIDISYYVGFTLLEVKAGAIGVISEIDDSTENTLFVINKDDDELLIPVGEDYIKHIDHEQKIIQVELPDGLLDLYL